MNRRDTLAALLALGISSDPLGAQPPGKVYRIGAAWIAPRRAIEDLLAAFEQGLREHGYVNGRNIALEYRFSDGKPELTREVVRSNVDLIVTGVNPQTAAAKAATQTIPIVMIIGQDVVGQGFVASHARPGGNITGLIWEMGAGPTAKRLELLKEAAPRISRVAVLFDPPYGEKDFGLRRAIEDAASALKLNLSWADITDDFERGFASALRERPEALFWFGHARQRARRAEIVALTAKHRLPASYHGAEFVEAGGLMSYAPNVPDLFRRAGKYVDRILKGAKPGDLPVEQPTKFEFVINQKTAKALGLTLPQSLLLRADRVI